jgi:serine/threonine protein kinase
MDPVGPGPAQTGPFDSGKPALSFAPGTVVIPGYELVAELGRGGMGVVYKAEHSQLKRSVAIKVILAGQFANGEARARFLAEGQALARLQHPGIVQIHDLGQHDDKPYLILEFVEGGSLDGRLNGTPWEPVAAATLVAKLARTMQFVHDVGVLHRDLKPANVLLTAAGEPKISDFGLAKQLDAGAALTASGAVVGTPSYMAPEQAGGRKRTIGPRTDVYALGAILYELLTGRPPFLAETRLDTILQVVSAEPEAPRKRCPQLSRDLETICLKCLHKDPSHRYASARELAEDLERFQRREPIQGRRLPLRTRLLATFKLWQLIAAVAFLLVLMITGVFWRWGWLGGAAAHRPNLSISRSQPPASQNLREKLNRPVTLDKGIDPGTPFKDTMEFLADRYGIQIVVDRAAIRAVGDDADDREVQLPAMSNVPLEKVIGLLCHQAGVCGLAKEEHYLITTLLRIPVDVASSEAIRLRDALNLVEDAMDARVDTSAIKESEMTEVLISEAKNLDFDTFLTRMLHQAGCTFEYRGIDYAGRHQISVAREK